MFDSAWFQVDDWGDVPRLVEWASPAWFEQSAADAADFGERIAPCSIAWLSPSSDAGA